MSTSACWNNISFFVGTVTLLKMQLCYASPPYLLRYLRCIKTFYIVYHFRLKIYKDRSCLGIVSVGCKRRSPRCDFTQWYIYIYIYLIFILQFLLLYTHSCSCGDITRWCCRMMTRVSTNGEQAAEPVKKNVFKFRISRHRRDFFNKNSWHD